MDCCLFDWIRNGKNIVEEYVENHPPVPGTDEDEILQAYLQAKYRIIVPRSRAKSAGVHCLDLFSSEEFFLMDIGISESPLNIAYATRTIPLGQYWITGGAALPTGQEGITSAVDQLRKKRLLVDGRFSGSHQATLVLVRSLLANGASQHTTYGTFDAAPRQSHGDLGWTNAPNPRPFSSNPGRNSRCPCGSGKRYKKCCGSKT
jgi:hypothetical protein